jgi:hypothetical protein
MTIFCGVSPWSLIEVWGTCCLHHQGPHRPDDGGSKYLRNVGKLVPDCTVQQPRKVNSPPWEPEVSPYSFLFTWLLLLFFILLWRDPSPFAFLFSIITLLYLCLSLLIPYWATGKIFFLGSEWTGSKRWTSFWEFQKMSSHQKLLICYDLITRCQICLHEANTRSAGTQIPSLLWDLNVH